MYDVVRMNECFFDEREDWGVKNSFKVIVWVFEKILLWRVVKRLILKKKSSCFVINVGFSLEFIRVEG